MWIFNICVRIKYTINRSRIRILDGIRNKTYKYLLLEVIKPISSYINNLI